MFVKKKGTCCAGIGLGLFLAFSPLHASPPPWWAARGVINANSAPSDYSLINQGQLKHLVLQGYLELEARLPGGGGLALWELLEQWPFYGESSSDYSTVNIGQLKNVASLFFDRLSEVGYNSPPVIPGNAYPWSTSTEDDDDYAYANIGQAKQLFSFNLGTDMHPDADGDNMPDSWESQHNLNPFNGGDRDLDADSDGISNYSEFVIGLDPRNPADSTMDFDGDLVQNREDARPGNPNIGRLFIAITIPANGATLP